MANNFYSQKSFRLGLAVEALAVAARHLQAAVKLEATVNPDGDTDLNYLLEVVLAEHKDAAGQLDAVNAMVAAVGANTASLR